MSPYYKGAAMLLRLVAAGMMAIGGLNTLLEFTRQRLHRGELSVTRCVLYGLLCLAGLVLLTCSASLARRWTEDFDD
jgi:hypothetical protein